MALDPLRAAGLRVIYSDARSGTHGSALLARPGIVATSRLAAPPWNGDCAMPLLTARVQASEQTSGQTSGQTLGLIAAHGPPPVPACREDRRPYLRALTRLVEGGQATRAVGAVSAGLPIVLAGDLNALQWEAPVRALAERGLIDAFDTGSWRLGPTWRPHPWSPALARIDYIFAPPGWPAWRAHAANVPGSDHRAVVVDLAML